MFIPALVEQTGIGTPLQSPLWHGIYFEDRRLPVCSAQRGHYQSLCMIRVGVTGGGETRRMDCRYFGHWAVGAGASGMIIGPCFE